MSTFVLRRVGAIAAASMCVVLAAGCGSAATDPATVPTTGATAPTATLATPAPAAPTSAGGASSATAPTGNADAITLLIDPSSSTASYHAHEQLVGRTLPSEAVGTTSAVSGSLVMRPDGSIAADQSSISVDLGKLQSDESRRDNFIKRSTLQTSRYPMATFVPREVQGLGSPLPTSGSATFQLMGDLTVHGVTKPVTWQVAAQFGETALSGDATTTVNITDFGMTPPKAGPVLSIEDGLTLELAFTAARQA